MRAHEVRSGGWTRSRELRIVLTVVTVVWLLALAFATVRQTDRLYPVTSYSMFSHPTGGLNVQFDLEGVTAAGEPVVVAPEELGLTRLQLRSYLSSNVGADPGRRPADAEDHVGAVARAWSERTGTALTELTVVRVEHAVDRDDPLRVPVQEWSR